MRHLNQTGDTIIEVLIAMALVGVMLAGAYTSSHHSLLATRQAQEHTEALKYAESQLEQLQAASIDAASPIYTIGSPFYMGTAGCVPAPTPTAGSCTIPPIPYTVSDTSTNPNPNQYIFTVTVTWPSLQGSVTDQVSLTYKLDKSP